ncbi:crotonase/enoyl-CoA hydratase family protein [Thioclava sp.]|uniref:crotonase/enoyl-CoA hydratase family protein n=1 Tax=Thioclava sp. TaxID=1933450 RepID=UPI003241C7F8
MADPVQISVSAQGVAEVTLNRPEKKNAWTLEMFDALADAAQSLSQQKGLRAVILSGAGGCFSAGLDLSVMQSFAADLAGVKAQMVERDAQGANRFQRPVTRWAQLPVSVIAAIEGVAFGAGMQLALGADFRIAAPGARLSIMEAKWGLIPDMGISQSLPKLTRADVAKELMMTGRVLEAEEAQALGLITRVAESPLQAARDMAAEFALRSPEALAASKALVEQAWTMPPGDGLALEAELQAEIIGGPAQMEMVMANLQKRAPNFSQG